MLTLRSLSASRGLPLLLLLGPAAIAQGTTLTAVSAGPRSPFPDPSSNSFENPAVGAGQFQYGSWGPWAMSATAGISSDNSPLTGTQAAPLPTRVAFLQGPSQVSTLFTFAAGNWRLRFSAAQRANGGASHQVVKVLVGATEVFEAEPNTTYTNFITRTITFASTTTTTVTFAGPSTNANDTAFLDAIEFERVNDWHAQATWSPQQIPGQFDAVVIPIGVEVAIRGTAIAESVAVNGELVTGFEDATLDARWVAVSGIRARFEVGQERTPFEQNFTLTLLGAAQAQHSVHAGTKFLMAMDGGTIDMHGVDKKSWTNLTSFSSGPSQTVITVVDRSGWAVGDEVVIAYTGHVGGGAGWDGVCDATPYDGPRSQKRTLTAIAPNGDITLAGQLDPADHCTAAATTYGGPPPAPNWSLDQRAEVGMLTRNVRIRGSVSASRGFGGHVMIMACCTVMPVGFGRFANVELSNMGQEKTLGRYPIHWHMVRNERPGQYVRNSSIHDCHNRAITVHGSHNVLVEGNVCFDTVGHAVFLEDGVEQDNVFIGNLVLATRKPLACEQMLPHDNSLDQAQNHAPAAFWISNPANHFVGNVAADSFGCGYWFAIHTRATGTSTKPEWLGQFPNFAGTLADLGTFEDNVAHSLKMGIDVHDSVRDMVGATIPTPPCVGGTGAYCSGSAPPGPSIDDPRDDDIATNVPWRPVTPAVLTRFTAYGCSTALYTGGGGPYQSRIRFDQCVLADNGVHVQFASSDVVRHSVFVHDTGNLIFPTGLGNNGMSNVHLHPFERGNAYVVYDGPAEIRDCHFVGFDSVSRGGNLVYGEFGAAQRHTNHVFANLTFAGGGQPAIQLPDYPGFPSTAIEAQPFIWGIAIRDDTGCLTGGTIPSNPNSPFWPSSTPHTLVTNHPMMHLTNGAASPDLQAPWVSTTSHAWLSPFRWGHLQLRYFVGETYNPSRGLFATYSLLSDDNLPPASFTRRSYQGWPGATFNSVFVPAGGMRQLPVIVRPVGTSATECEYEVTIHDPQSPMQSHGRVDVSVDDVDNAGGDVTRLIITHATQPAWMPELRINDNPLYIYGAGEDPNNLLPMNAGPPGGSSSYQLTALGGSTAIDLRLVNPNRTHRITITW